MVTRRDLVEAHAFSRRRLVAAFVSGAPGGREAEPARPGRSVVAGAALSVLLLAGAAIAGAFAAPPSTEWLRPGLVLSKDTGAPFVVLENSAGQLVVRPVVNITSAKLLVGSGDRPRSVPQARIDEQALGDYIGIAEAPATLPGAARMIDEGWTACLGDGTGVRLTLAERPSVTPAPTAGFVVDVGDESWLVAGARSSFAAGVPQVFSLALPDDDAVRSTLLRDLGLGESYTARQAPRDWLTLFPSGEPLDRASFRVEGRGKPVDYASELGGTPAAVGDLVRERGRTEWQLLLADGPTVLDPFSEAVYRTTATFTEHEVSRVDRAPGPPTYPAHWPDSLLAPVHAEYCAVLHPQPGGRPLVALATDPGDGASAAHVEWGRSSVRVDPGRGAHFVSGGWDRDSGRTRYVVDPKGVRHELQGEASDLLGYGDHAPRLVPDAWAALFEEGVRLSRDAALCGPARRAGECS